MTLRRTARTTVVLGILLGSLTACGWVVRESYIGYMKVNSLFAAGEIEIDFNRTFVEKYKNRIEINTNFMVDAAVGGPVANILDGDFHFSGRTPQIQLPVIGEISNAADYPQAQELIHAAVHTGGRIKVSGVWKVWPEHPGREKQTQGKKLEEFDTSNPDHVFEIHPVTEISGYSLLASFRPVSGFKPGGAEITFGGWDKATCNLIVKDTVVTMIAATGLYNDVEFQLQVLDEPPFRVHEGRFVYAAALDLNGKVLVPRIRTIFVEGTPPYEAVRHLNAGGRLHVFAMPRVDFAEISRRIRNRESDPAGMKKNLPYELIILGVYPK